MATYTFDPALSTNKDFARSRLYDTGGSDGSSWIFADETYEGYFSRISNFSEALAQMAEAAAGWFARTGTSVRQRYLTVDMGDPVKFYMSLAESIRANALPGPDDPPYPGSVGGFMSAPGLTDWQVPSPPYVPDSACNTDTLNLPPCDGSI